MWYQKLYFSISTSFWIFYTLLYFFKPLCQISTSIPQVLLYGRHDWSCELPKSQKALLYNSKRLYCATFSLPIPLYLDYLERDQNMQDQSIWLPYLPQYLEKNICLRQFESSTILPDWELPLLIGAYLTPSRLLASLGYNNRCYTQNFVRVNGCCWWMLFVCWSVIGLQWSILVQTITPSHIAAYDPFPGFYHFGMLFNFFKTSILQTLLAISNPTYLVTNCKYGHFIFLLPFRSYTMAEWQNISISHAGYTYAIFICHFPKLLHVSFKPLHLELSFRCTILSSAMAHHPFVYQVFSSLFLWSFFSSYAIRQNLLITFWWIWILYDWTLFLQLVIPEDVATDHQLLTFATSVICGPSPLRPKFI